MTLEGPPAPCVNIALLIPEHFKQPKNVIVFSGDESFPDSSCVIEKRGEWFAPYLATLITSAGRLLLAMLEVEVTRAGGTYLYCDTDSLAIVASNKGGTLNIPGAHGKRILTWDGFRVVEYGKSRKVVLSDSLKREIQGTKLQRELRRRGIGQHTIEKALHAQVRVNTYRKIVSAIEEYKRDKVHDPERKAYAIQRPGT